MRICKRQLAECEQESVGGEHGCWLGHYKIQKICTKTGLLGTGGATKSDEFSEKLQTVFDIPLIFGILEFLEYPVAFFFRKALFKAPKCKINWIENDAPVLELFQKFIRFSGATRPLMSKMQKKTSGPIIPHSFLVMCFCSILVYRQEKGFYLWIWSLGSSQQPFSCAWGYFL